MLESEGLYFELVSEAVEWIWIDPEFDENSYGD